MLNYSFPCSCSKNLSSFRFTIKQQWTIVEISIFSNSSHLEWRAGLSDTILKGTIPARFGLIWFKGFRGEDLNVKVYDVRRTPSDGKNHFRRLYIYIYTAVYQWCEFKSRRGKNKNLTALKSNSNAVWFNFQTLRKVIC